MSSSHIKDDDLVLVPRGLLAAASHAMDKGRRGENTLALLREFAKAPGVRPKAYLHKMHKELRQSSTEVTLTKQSPFGVQGIDFDPTYFVTRETLYCTGPLPDLWKTGAAHEGATTAADKFAALEALL